MRRLHGRWARVRVRSISVLAVLLLAAVTSPADAVTLNWANAAGGSAATAANWSPAQVPAAADDLIYNLAGTYTITFNFSVPESRTHTYRLGVITLSISSPHTASTGITVGDLSGDNATMTLTSGTLTSNAAVVIGDASGSTGRINANDSDATLIIGNGADLTVGLNGAGTLSITGAGHVEVADQFIAGSNSTSASSVTVSGSQVGPIASSTLEVLGLGESRVGQGGDVTMTVASGALASFAGDLVIANGSASTSSITVQTVGVLFDARLNVDGDLLIGRNSSVTTAGNGTLNVNTGGTVSVGGGTFLGDPNGGTGTLQMGGGTFNGTGVLNVLSGSSMGGTGTVNADITNNGNISPSGASGLTLNGLLSNATDFVVGTKIHFGPGGGYLGSGTCQADITGDATAAITATGDLTIGKNDAAGFFYLGALSVGSHLVTLVDSNQAVLGGPTTLDGGTLACATGLGVQLGGSVSGEGTLDGNVVSSGIIQPVGFSGAGVITIDGTFLANPSSEIDFEIAGPGISTPLLVVTGPMTLGGTVNITLAPGYLPQIGEQIILMNSTTPNGRTGTFATVNHTPLCDQYTLVMVYSTTAAIALVRPGLGVTSVGDVDRDGDQDLDDFARWLPCLAGPGVLTPPPGCDPDDFHNRADLDGPACDDYDVDLRDLAVFQRILSP